MNETQIMRAMFYVFAAIALMFLGASAIWFKTDDILLTRGHAIQAGIACGVFSLCAISCWKKRI